MNRILTSRQVRFCMAVVFFIIVASGCATSPPSRFYSLSSLNPPESSAPGAENAAIVAIGPVTIPDYVDRPEIITTDGPNEVRVHDFERWAGALDRNMSRVIVDDLTSLLPADRFNIVRWNPSINVNIIAANRVMVDVTRFDVSPGPEGAAIFEADWVLYGRHSKVLTIKKSSRKVPVKGNDFKDMTAALSQCVSEFSGDVAAAITAANGK